jgi:hypothetical protein
MTYHVTECTRRKQRWRAFSWELVIIGKFRCEIAVVTGLRVLLLKAALSVGAGQDLTDSTIAHYRARIGALRDHETLVGPEAEG